MHSRNHSYHFKKPVIHASHFCFEQFLPLKVSPFSWMNLQEHSRIFLRPHLQNWFLAIISQSLKLKTNPQGTFFSSILNTEFPPSISTIFLTHALVGGCSEMFVNEGCEIKKTYLLPTRPPSSSPTWSLDVAILFFEKDEKFTGEGRRK